MFVGTPLLVCALAGALCLLPEFASAQAGESRVVGADTQFGIELLQRLTKAEAKPSNVLLSPASIAAALTMAYNGAEGETRQEMAHVLGLQGLKLEQANEANAALHKALETKAAGMDLRIANAIWADRRDPFLPAFVDRCKRFYGAEAASVDFSRPADAVGRINVWVSGKTDAKIPRLLTPRDVAGASGVLTNAVYLKGTWTTPFDKRQTRQEPFHLADGGTVNAQMMHQPGRHSYLKRPGLQAMSLPYGDGRFSMCILLPDDPAGLPAFIGGLTEARLREWLDALKPTTVSLAMPLFNLRWKDELGGPLTALGMKSAFNPQTANFSAMFARRGRMFISKVVHECVVDVNEEGTEAAAATGVVMTRSAALASMRVDHPFLFLIRDSRTGAVLFAGAVANPA